MPKYKIRLGYTVPLPQNMDFEIEASTYKEAAREALRQLEIVEPETVRAWVTSGHYEREPYE